MDAGDNPELQAKLEELELELEEGDITQKGYQKRRTQLLAQFLGTSSLAEPRGLRIHAPNDSPRRTNEGSRNASLAAPNGSETEGYQRQSIAYSDSPDIPAQSPARISSGRFEPTPNSYQPYSEEIKSELSPNPETRGLTPIDSPNIPRPPIEARESLYLDVGGNPFSPGPSQGSVMSMTSGANYTYNAEHQEGYQEHQPHAYIQSQSGTLMYDQSHGGTMPYDESQGGTMLDAQQVYFSDFAGQQAYDNQPQQHAYAGGMHRYSVSDTFSPTAGVAPPML
ncbi:hypothetical protein V491_05299, partial [Pseudogymnoascus sp. VKM F-3775]